MKKVKYAKIIEKDNLHIFIYYDNNITDGIESITTIAPVVKENNNIYSIDGRFVGTEKASLKSGLYIMNGKKVVVK